ncbi:methyltransferase [Devosia sp. Root685]|uniref:class I SAM-dependent methyltransferase n=1 Tax=Devosia sp. Root685 TaxID=1736587 RepID=UPI0006F50A8B|nr:class I SAM-dependent methyltransferase [Devosia sp. Root685]KRA99152.1 methyltransferase [Devosia sp. Root685]
MTSHFNAQAARNYADGPPRQVPGFAGIHRMMNLLLAETLPNDAQILVLGAGGGLEIKAMADFRPGWRFSGVDPSADMLNLAREITADHAPRVDLAEGYIDAAPEGPFDAATSVLVFHFIPREQRLETLRQIRRRLKPGAPFILAHISFPQTEPERSTWIARHVAYGQADDVDLAVAAKAREAIGTRLTILAPEEEEAMLREAGFANISLFYSAFSFRGWVAYAG